MRITIGCDHRGLEHKRAIMGLLAELGHEYQDVGCYTTDAVDYPDVAQEVAQSVATGESQQGILICGTGIGMSIAANKVPGVRAAVCGDAFSARMARQHNDANVLCLGGLVLGQGRALDIVRTYLEGAFEDGRHGRRVGKIQAQEQGRAGVPAPGA